MVRKIEIVGGMKRCPRCCMDLPVSSFSAESRSSSGLTSRCRKCVSTACAARPVLQKQDQMLRQRYGISVYQYNEMYDQQRGHCALCGVHQSTLTYRLSVDHHHETGKVRALLCQKCNWIVGVVETSDLLAAKSYIEKFEGIHVGSR